MAGDPVNDYLDAKATRDAATQKIDQMARAVFGAGQKLTSGWRRLTVAGAGGFSMNMIRAEDVPTWPTAQEIRIALLEWHKLELATQNTWNAVPQNKRGGLISPDS
jgi:hypothetical protein